MLVVHEATLPFLKVEKKMNITPHRVKCEKCLFSKTYKYMYFILGSIFFLFLGGGGGGGGGGMVICF